MHARSPTHTTPRRGDWVGAKIAAFAPYRRRIRIPCEADLTAARHFETAALPTHLFESRRGAPRRY